MNIDKPKESFSQEVRAAILARQGWGIEALRRLISIDSIAPHERECQEAFAEILHSEGLSVERRPLDDGSLRSVDGFIDAGLSLDDRPNLIANYGGQEQGGRSLILNGHIDTVSWQDQLMQWGRHPLSGEMIDGKLYGRGAIDDKGPLIAGAMAILALKDLGFVPPGKVSLTSVVGEEPSGNGTLAMCSQGYLSDAAIVMEPTSNHVVFGHRGIIGIRYLVGGEARHSSVGSKRANAIVEAGALAKLYAKSLEDWGDPSDEIYGFPSLNIGRICGGEDIFTTPQSVYLDCCVRYAPGMFQATLDHIDRHLQEHAPMVLESNESITREVFAHYDAAETDPNSPIAQTLLASVREVDADRDLRTFLGGCDARHLINRYQVPTVIFGPGDLHLAHAANEYLDIDQWIRAAQALALCIVRWCR